MAIYCIGDVHGCDDALGQLLERIDFSPSRDIVYLLGDLVNRGPDSASVLRRCMRHEGALRALLGNHDLHLLAMSCGARKAKPRDSSAQILQARDGPKMLDWLRAQPLAIHVRKAGEDLLLVHAGVLPSWGVGKTLSLATEAHEILVGKKYKRYFKEMYGNLPDRWDDSLGGVDRWRAILNALTRLRFCTADGVMDFDHVDSLEHTPAGEYAWFDVPGRKTADAVIAFGHWSTLQGMNRKDVIAADTGCIWGGKLSAVRFGVTWADRQWIQIPCPQVLKPRENK